MLKKLEESINFKRNINYTGSLFQTFYNLVDTYFAGRISPEALAAIAKSWPIYFIAIAVAVGIGAGTTALISNSIGAKEDRKASMYVAQSIILAIVVSIFVTLFGLNFSDELLRIMGSTEESIILTRKYLDIIFFGAIIVLVQLSLNGTLNAQGDTKSYRNVLIFTFFLNIFLNPLFIFGYGFIPAFGIAGLAIATIVSQCIGLIYLANKVYCCKLKKFLYLECFKPKIDFLSSLFKQSVPIMFTMLMIMFGVFNIFYFVGQFGELATAGYGTCFVNCRSKFWGKNVFQSKRSIWKSFNVWFRIYGVSRYICLFNFRNYNFFFH